MAARHLVDEEEVHDAFGEERVTEKIEIAYLNLRYGAAREQIEGRVCLGVARVREVVNARCSSTSATSHRASTFAPPNGSAVSCATSWGAPNSGPTS